MTALPEDAPLTRRQVRESQQSSTPESESPNTSRRRASTSGPVAGGQIPQQEPVAQPSAQQPASVPPANAPASSTASGAPAPAATGGLTRRQLRELERTGSIEQVPAPAAPVAPPVEDPAPSVALPPRSPEQVVAAPQKQSKAAKQHAAKAAQQAAAAKATAEREQAEARSAAKRDEAAARKRSEQQAAEQQAAEQQAAEQQAAEHKAAQQKAERRAAEQKAAEQKAAEQQAASADRAAQASATTGARGSAGVAVATDSLFDASDRDDISEDPASTLSKGFGRDSMLVAALEAEKASQAETGVAFEDLLGNGMTTTGQITTSSLIIPVAPAQAEAGATSNSTGEILITGTIDLPRGLGSSGQDPNHFDGAGIDRLIEGDELPASVTAASPVAASKAVSSHGSTRDVVPATTNQSNKLLMTLAIAAAVLAAGVIAVLIIGFLGGAF